MRYFFPGFSGLLTVTGVLVLLWLGCRLTKKYEVYDLDPKAQKGAFEPLLLKYLDLTKFTISLASGSIVLLIGSSIFHGQSGRLPWQFASPLLVLAACVLAGLSFMSWLVLEYEEYQHGNPHTAAKYAVSETLGFSTILFFVIGYSWLIIVATR
jgi:multisubunit Na+/H+ antiporter MnhB subunit